MPRTAPAGIAAECAKAARADEIVLVDVETFDGTQFFWSDYAYTISCALDGTTKTYTPWVKEAGPFRRSKNLATDAGDIVLQNVGGDLIERDLGQVLKAHEFEGALAIVRFLIPLADIVTDEYHGTLSEQNTDELEGRFRHLQLLDLNARQQPIHDLQPKCPLTFKSPACGSTGGAVVCGKTLTDCGDASRAAVERFQGVTVVAPESVAAIVSTFGGGSGTGSPPGGRDGGAWGFAYSLGNWNTFGVLPIPIPVVPKMRVK